MNKYIDINAKLSMFSKNYMDLKKNLPIRPSEMAVLNIITQKEGKYTPVILAKMLNVSKPMITAHITILENKGYITKEISKDDKRVYYVIPTDKALMLVDKMNIVLIEHLSKLEQEMGFDKFIEFIDLIDNANKIIEGEIRYDKE